jgi:hypothetical protein
MCVPAYYRSHHGHVFRVQRAHEPATNGGTRYVLRAFPLQPVPAERTPVAEAAEEVHAEDLRDRIRHGQAVTTAEQTFAHLWQRLRLELEAL